MQKCITRDVTVTKLTQINNYFYNKNTPTI